MCYCGNRNVYIDGMTKEKTSNHQNGKGDSPRNNTSRKFRDNYNKINWKKKIDKPKKK